MRYRLDDLEIDLSRQHVLRDGVVLDVSGLSFQLLACLLEHGNKVVGFDELMTAVWSPAIVNEETVTQRVRLLRAALGDDGRRPRYIRSVRGQGYQLCNEAVVLNDTSAETRKFHQSPVLLLTVALVVASVSLLILRAPSIPPITGQVDVLLQRADHYAEIGQAENNARAIDLYRQALEHSPQNVPAKLGLSFALSAQVCRFDQAPELAQRAAELARGVLDSAGNNARAHAALGYAYDCLGLIDDALAEYERAVTLDPDGRQDSASSAAYLYGVKGQLANALRFNLLAVPRRNGDGDGDGDAMGFENLQIARCLELLGFSAAAEQRYAEVFRLYPDNVFGNVAYPASLFRQGRMAEAEAVLSEAMSRPARPELLVLAGEMQLLRGDRSAARSYFGKAASIREQQSFAAMLVVLYGDVPPDEAWFEERVAALQRAIEDGDRWPDNWLELALLNWHRGHSSLAFAALDAAIDNGFRDAAYLRVSPLFHAMKDQPGFVEAIDRIATEIVSERKTVLAAEWLPADVASAGR